MSSNPEVIELLEAYLETARKHRFGHVAISMVAHPNVCARDYAGDISLELGQRDVLATLHGLIDASIKNWTPPPRDESLDASYVRYNIANGPLGFDFLTWLIDAEMTRIRADAPAPLKVGFWLGKDADDRMNRDRRRMWLDNVFRPMLKLIGAVEDSTAIAGRCKEVFVPRDIVTASRAGEAVPMLKPILPWPSHGHVTITLREAAHSPHRNSSAAWLVFASHLAHRGEEIIFVRDTAKAQDPVPGFRTCHEASHDLETRMALYAAAKTNLFVSNGPASLCFYSRAPWMAFITAQAEDQQENCNSPNFWRESFAMNPGEQFPWSAPDQRLVWKRDTYENLLSAWNEYQCHLTN